MAEASPSDGAGHNIRHSPGARENFPAEPHPGEQELRESASPASNPALNRSAEVVGLGVGTAVAGVRRLPQQLDKLRSRIHLVPSGSGAAAQEIRDAAVDAAVAWQNAAEDTVSELTHRVEKYTYEASEGANRRRYYLRRQIEWRIGALQQQARQCLATARRWGSERPGLVIGACAAAAFAAGVALRVWRSNHD